MLDEYRRAVAKLAAAAAKVRTGSQQDWDANLENYRKAKERCEKARTTLLDAIFGSSGATGPAES